MQDDVRWTAVKRGTLLQGGTTHENNVHQTIGTLPYHASVSCKSINDAGNKKPSKHCFGARCT